MVKKIFSYLLMLSLVVMGVNGAIEDTFNRIDNNTLGTATNGNTWNEDLDTNFEFQILDNHMFYSEQGDGSNYNNAMSLQLSSQNPSRLDLWNLNVSRSDSGNIYPYIFLGDSFTDSTLTSAISLFLHRSTSSQMVYYDDGWKTTNYVYSLNDVINLSLRNINYTAGTFDIYVNDVLEKTSATFQLNENIDYINIMWTSTSNHVLEGKIDCISTEGDVCLSFPPSSLTIGIENPTNGYEFTFDVENTTLNISTSANATCEYEYENVNYTMSTTDNIYHDAFFTMGIANNSQKQFDVTYHCEDTSTNVTTSQGITFYQAQSPLDFFVLVPQDLQEFNRDVNVIEYHIVTNYQATCSQLTYNMTSYEVMDVTGTEIHKHNYSTFFPNVDTYPVSFECTGIIINETIQKNVTFLLTDEFIGNETYTYITDVTGNLPQVGSDVGGFMDGIFMPTIALVMGMAIIGGIVLIFSTISSLIVRALK